MVCPELLSTCPRKESYHWLNTDLYEFYVIESYIGLTLIGVLYIVSFWFAPNL